MFVWFLWLLSVKLNRTQQIVALLNCTPGFITFLDSCRQSIINIVLIIIVSHLRQYGQYWMACNSQDLANCVDGEQGH